MIVVEEAPRAGHGRLRTPSTRRAVRRRLVPALAGLATVLAVVLAAAGIFAGIGPASRPASFGRALPGGVPRFYLTVAEAGRQLRAEARDSASGRVTGSVTVPVSPQRDTSWQIAAAADHRHFVIAVAGTGTSSLAVFSLTLSPRGRPALGKHRTARRTGEVFQSLALSPDGTVAALAFASSATQSGAVTALSLTTGKVRTWSGVPGYLTGGLSFLGRTTLAVPWVHYLSQSAAVLAGVRMLNISRPGGSLLAARLVAFRTPRPAPDSAIVTAAGRQIIASSCQASGGRTVTARVVILSGTDGHLLRVLRTDKLTVPARGPVPSAQPLTLVTCPVLSVDSTGRHVLTEAFRFGRLDNGRFTGLTADAGPFYAAW